MRETTFSFKSCDDVEVHVYKWEPEIDLERKAVVQIVHGSVEHAYRYKDFATYLTDQGFIVYANDHRGHGKTVGLNDELSYFSDLDDGFEIAVDDLKRLNERILQEHNGLKVFALGHSLGSFMLRKYMTKYPDNLDGVLLSGTGGGKDLLVSFGIMMARNDLKRKGRKYHSLKLHNLLYGTLNNEVKDAKTDVDFISRDEKIVEDYIKDPYCGHTITTEYALESLKGIKYCSSKESFKNISNALPIYLFSGQYDPVGGKNAREVRKVFNKYIKYGSEDVEIKIYDGARHEILNEINKHEVYKDVVDWMTKKL